MGEIAVLIPTLRRNESLERALLSLSLQDDAQYLIDAVVVVDNSPEGSARPVAEAWAATLPVLYVHEPRPGVATARNAGLGQVAAPYVAFLDDDQEAPPHWLGALFATHKALQADVTFGPCRGVAAAAPPWARAYLDGFFSRTGPAVSGPTEERHGCGNAMMTRATALSGDAPFDAAHDQIGGEDDRLFQRLDAQGGRFAWCAEAWVWEHASAHRCRVSYVMRRAFSYGQTPTTDAAHLRNWSGVARWMAIGAAQAAVYGAAAAGLWALRSPKRLPLADRAVRGLGKVIWWVTPKFYGQAEVARTSG
jgi:glycosyltransferase involved in cell wall biosynthesis